MPWGRLVQIHMRALAAALGLLAAAPSARADAPPNVVAAIADYCTSEGAFGQQFGSREIIGTVEGRALNSVFLAGDGGYAPFAEFEVVHTPRSRSIHSVSGWATLENAEYAHALFDAVTDTLQASNRFVVVDRVDQDQVEFFSAPLDAEGQPRRGYQLGLLVRGERLHLSCVDRVIFGRAIQEF